MNTLSCELRIRPELLGRIMLSWASYQHTTDSEDARRTSYWKKHASYISIHRVGDDVVQVRGQSGFYFPGNSYSGVDTLNALMAFVRFHGRIKQDLSLSSIPAFTRIRARWSPLPATCNFDWLRMLSHIAAIRKGYAQPLSAVAEIGSGTGILALAFKRIYPDIRYTCIDLPETLHLACCFLASAIPDARFVFPNEFREGKGSDGADIVFVDNAATDRIPSGSQELAVNTDSMQEMNPSTIQGYFTLLRRILTGPRLFYQSNREAKLMDGAAIKPVEFPWNDTDRHLFFQENEFMRFVFGLRHKRGIPYVVPTWRKHLQSLTTLS